MAETLNIKISGSGPYGFRLLGGEGQPLAVSKLRQKSKAYEGGLREGDALLGINGLSCETMSHAQAAALLDTSTDHLDLHVIRGAVAKEALTSAYQSLSSVLRKPTPTDITTNITTTELDLNSQPSHTAQTSYYQPTVSYMSSAVSSVTVGPQFGVYNFEPNQDSEATLKKSQHDIFLIQQGKIPEDIKEEFNGKQEIIVYRHKPNLPGDEFTVPKITLTQQSKPGNDEENYAPTKGCTAVSLAILSDNNGKGKSLKYGDDWPTIIPRLKPLNDMPTKFITDEALASYIKFHISQFPGEPWLWQPSQVYQVLSKNTMEEFTLDKVTQEDIDRLREELIAKHSPSGKEGADDEEGQNGSKGRAEDDVPLHLLKILTTIEDVDPTYWKRKKIYADSSFYDDPAHTYPTIQEQIKMARGVALSLTSAENAKARGQRMFLKRKERSNLWDIDNPSYHRQVTPLFGGDSYFNPKPWSNMEPPSKGITPVSWEKKLEVKKIVTSLPVKKPAITWGPKNNLQVPKQEVTTIKSVVTSTPDTKPEISWDPKNKVIVPDVFVTPEFRPKPQPKKKRIVEFRPRSIDYKAVGGFKIAIDGSDELISKHSRAGKLFAQRRAKSEEPGDREPIFEKQAGRGQAANHEGSLGGFQGDNQAASHGGSRFSLGRPLREALNNIDRRDPTSPPSDPGLNGCRLREMIAEYGSWGEVWSSGGALKRTEEMFGKTHKGVARSTSDLNESKGENGPRLKLKSSGGYRPVNFKAPVRFDQAPSPQPHPVERRRERRERHPADPEPTTEQGECQPDEPVQQANTEAGVEGITDF